MHRIKKLFINEFVNQVFEGLSNFLFEKKIAAQFSLLKNIGAATRRFYKHKKKKNALHSIKPLNIHWTTDLGWYQNSKISN